MRASDQVLAASARWLDLLRRSSLGQAWSLIGNDPRFADLSRTQYHAGLEWLLARGLVVEVSESVALSPRAASLPVTDILIEVMSEALEMDQPPWLLDADELVRSPDDLPSDAERLAEALGVPDDRCLLAVRRAQAKVDLETRARVGAAGERALLAALEERWPGSTTHVSALDDTAGYDIAVNLPSGATHVEVKSTNRRGRLDIYLSRHEYETSRLDPLWRLVVVGLDGQEALAAVATVHAGVLGDRAPADSDSRTSWDSARFRIDGGDLDTGFRPLSSDVALVLQKPPGFAWLPTMPTESGETPGISLERP